MIGTHIKERLTQIRGQIQGALTRSKRSGETVRLIGVTKGKSADEIAIALTQGLEDFGENYVQEWRKKFEDLQRELGKNAHRITWHFIGHLQGNKVQGVVGAIPWIHTVDSLKLARKISQTAGEKGCVQKVLIEVNLAEEPHKPGFLPPALREVLPEMAALPHLSWRGLMAIPPEPADPEANRPHFRALKSLLDECNQTGVLEEPLSELSMGMSRDFEVAIEEGATMVRIGTALFGPRE